MGRKMNLIYIIAIVLMIFPISALIACSSPTAVENANDTLENEVTLQLYDQVDKDNMTEAEMKMSTDIFNLVVDKTAAKSSLKAVTNSNGFQSSNFVPADPAKGVREDLVYVYVYLNQGSSTKVIEPFVQEITDRDEENSLAVAWVSVNKLKKLASLEEVRNIRTVLPPVVNIGKVTTEGDIIHGTASVRTNYGPDGSGIKIGVISDGVDNLADSQASGDLPADVTILKNIIQKDYYGEDIYENEGTAMLEIIHDMAPGAKLYFHEAGDNVVAFNKAVSALSEAGCNIIVDDIGWTDEPYFEDGIVASHVANIINSNSIVYVSAAGNDANCHYQETYINDGTNHHNTIIPVDLTGYLWYDYVKVILQWNDKYDSSSNDYDLRLYDENGIEVNSVYYTPGTSSQAVTRTPFEKLTFIAQEPQKVYIGISTKGPVEPKILELFIYTSGKIDSSELTAADSIYGHPAVPEVIAVGAINAFDENHDDIEYFSSQGPVTIAYPVASLRQKPDICGVDSVNISGAGGFGTLYLNDWRFEGTSAAAPHVAAVAAQIWSSNPSMTAAEVRNILLTSATDDRGIVGYDTVFGYGIANSSKYFKNQVTSVDKNELITAIATANAKVGAAAPGTDINQYPQAAIDAFKVAIAAAQAVVDNPAATQADVNQASSNLTTASAVFDTAKIATVDKVPLIAAIATANAKVGAAVAGTEDSQYPQAAIDAFKAAIVAAQAVVDNPAATQADVNQASANLTTASTAFDAAKIRTGGITLEFLSKFEGNIHDVVVAENNAYITDWKNPAVENGNSFVIVNITHPSTPILAGSIDVLQFANGGVAVSENCAYVADYWKGLAILDISNPSTPTLTGTYNTSSSSDVAVSDDYAYVADGVNGLVILDISNPSSPTLESTYSTSNYAGGVAVSGNYAYIANQDVYGKPHGLVIVDSRNPSSPTMVGNYDTVSDVLGVAVSGNHAYLANGESGLLILDVTNPSAPALVSSYDTLGSTSNVAVEGNYAYLADGGNGLVILDVTNPSAPTLLSSYDTLGSTSNVAVEGNYAYLADGDNGLVILRIDTNSTTKLPFISELSGKDITTNSITLSWTNSADVSRVDIYRNNVLLGNVTGSTTYVDGNLASDTTYSYTLIPYNMNGLAGEAVSISLKTKSSSSGGGGGGGSSGGSSSKKSSSSGGGGGGAGSVEDFANVAMKDVDNQYLKINANATYEFSREGNPIHSVSFYSLKNSGEITSTIEVLNNKSKLVNITPEEAIYKFVNIWVGKAGFATTTNIKDPSIKFKVTNSWIQEMGVNPEDVKLQRYNGKTWEVLPTTMESNTTDYTIFKAHTSGFSNFAITAEKVLASPIVNNAEDVSTIATEPEKTPGFGFGIAILMIGLSAVGYMYLKRQ